MTTLIATILTNHPHTNRGLAERLSRFAALDSERHTLWQAGEADLDGVGTEWGEAEYLRLHVLPFIAREALTYGIETVLLDGPLMGVGVREGVTAGQPEIDRWLARMSAAEQTDTAVRIMRTLVDLAKDGHDPLVDLRFFLRLYTLGDGRPD